MAPSLKERPPRQLTRDEQKDLEGFIDRIHYSSRYSDDEYEYRHVILPKAMLKAIPQDYFDRETRCLRILHEIEWRSMGVTQSLGWEMYEVHCPEPHILLFKRPKEKSTVPSMQGHNDENNKRVMQELQQPQQKENMAPRNYP